MQGMNIPERYLVHTKEAHLLQEDSPGTIAIGTGTPKYFQRTHSNGNLHLIILSLKIQMMGELFFHFNIFQIEISAYFRIILYSTTSTEDAVYIIGGVNVRQSKMNIIAKYQDEEWSIVGEMKTISGLNLSVKLGDQTMILDPRNETVEVWNLEQGKRLKSFKRSTGKLDYGYAVFLTNNNFCN